MLTFQTFLLGLLVVSTLTSLVTEAIKAVLAEHNREYHANTLAGVVSLFLSVAVGIGYVLINNLGFGTQVIVYLVALALMSWLCAMVGYDKVIQAIAQFKTTKE